MKYWIGYLTAAIIGAISYGLMELGKRYSNLVDMVYPYVCRTLQEMLAQWTAPLDFCLWQLAAVVLGAILVITIVLMLIFRWNPIAWAGWVLTGASIVFLLHTLAFGLGYYAGPIAEDLRLETREYSVEELANAASYYRDKANELAAQVKRDGEGALVYPEFEELAEMAGDGFKSLVYDRSYPIFAGCRLPVKKLGWADMYSSMGITGFTFGITGEAAVNPQIPVSTLPFTMCHEMAHRMCINDEGDANFAAFLACQQNESIEFQYSAYFMAYRYCISALASANSTEAAAAAARVMNQVGTQLRQDLTAYDRFFETKKNESATKVADTVNDTYLKTSGDTEGIASYGQVCDLLVAWHYQEIVVPSLTIEEAPFNPFDPSQVDLSGLVNAPVREDAA